MFVSSKAERVIKFVSILYQSIGLTLPQFQKNFIEKLYGTIDVNGYRQYQRVYYSSPRKNAKTTLAASLCLYHLHADDEPNPRIYIAAGDLDQTRETFEIIAAFCHANSFLDKNTVINDSKNHKEAIRYRDGKKIGYIQALTSRGSKEGKNPSVVIFDELCDWKETERPLWASMTMGSLARKQPLFFITTTAGERNEGICFEQYTYAKRVLSKTVKDETFLPFIIEANPDKWSDHEEWKRVNPLVSEGFIDFKRVLAEFNQSQASESELAKFKRKRLNIWVGNSFSYLDMAKWSQQKEPLDDAHLVGLPCVAGMDLSRRKDFTSVVLVFAEAKPAERTRYFVKSFFWLPEEGLKERQRVDGMPYDRWVEQGLLELSPGSDIDYHLVLNKLKELSAYYKIREIAYDPHNSAHLIQDLERAGYNLAEFRQGFLSMNDPMKELQSLVGNKLLIHGNNPILSWQAGALIAKEDEAANVKPSRKSRVNKIDGIVSIIMALGTHMRNAPQPKRASGLAQFLAA